MHRNLSKLFYIFSILLIVSVFSVSLFTGCSLEDLEYILDGSDIKGYDESGYDISVSQLDGISPGEKGKLTVTVIDVGQGDSIFIELPDGASLLIDAGTPESADKIASVISAKGFGKIDYVIATHPHADHIGGMSDIIERFDIGSIYMSRAVTNTKTFERLLEAISSKGLKIKTAKAGVSICPGVEIIAPNSDSYEDINNYSAVVRISYGSSTFLFMGDAEAISENEILDAGYDISADVIKVGHHGSSTSSCAEFVKRVGAKYAVFCVGKDNSYNHPHGEIVDRWRAANAAILRTDELGNIVFISDGEHISAACEKGE